MQGRDHYCDAIAGSTINVMNASANTNQIHHTTKTTMRTTPSGFRRRTMAGALLVMALTTSAVGFAAMSRADDDTQIQGTDPTTAAPLAAAALPWAPLPPAPWLDGLIDRALHSHLQCGYRGFEDQFRCDWY
jgi:hypothetical protein